MTAYLLDTNILSEILKPTPSPSLLRWMQDQQDVDLFISAITLGEIHKGILQMPAGSRRQDLEDWFKGAEGPEALFAGRILSFDEAAAKLWAMHTSRDKSEGRPRNPIDVMIGAVAEANDCTMVTNNEKDFHRFLLINPMR